MDSLGKISEPYELQIRTILRDNGRIIWLYKSARLILQYAITHYKVNVSLGIHNE